MKCTATVHTTLYGSAAGCRSIQKTCALWKHDHGLTSKNTQSVDIFLQIKYQPNIHHRRWYDMRSEDCNFYRNQTFGRRIYHFYVFFGRQKSGILTARLNKVFSIGSFQPNSNRGVHPMAWIFFLLSILVDIIETKKFCEFEISTLFRFRVVAIRNIWGVGAKSKLQNERPPKMGHILKLNPLKQWKSLF